MKKLPEEMKLIISREFDKVVWDIRVILEAFKREVQAREKLVLIKSSNSEQEYISKSKYSSGLTLYQQVSRGSPKCVFCSKTDHKPQDCVEVSNVQQRAAILKNSNRCFLCFRVGHMVRNCSAKFTCFNCKKRHHVAICQGKPHNLVVSEKQENQGQSSVSSNIAAAQTGAVNLIHDSNNVLLQTARASVTSTVGAKKGNFRFLFDLGSQLSYISPRACEVLKLKTVANHNINIKTFGGVNSEKSLNQVRFCVKDSSGNESIYVTGFVSDICQPLTGQAISYATKTFNNLKNLRLADANPDHRDLNVDILIGADYYWSFFNNAIVKGNPGEPVAMSTKLGYILSGPVTDTNSPLNSACTNTVVSAHVMKINSEILGENAKLSATLEKFWNLESLGINMEQPSVYDKFRHDVVYEKGRYQVKLPFKDHHDILHDNLDLSVVRLKGQWNKLKRDESMFIRYNDIFTEQESLGIIERVESSQLENDTPTHYMPHVVREDKATTKIRAVFDASAKKDGASLNECLHTGPSLTPSLYGVLMRFRAHNIAFMSDIEKAFLQIGIDPNDRDFLRFLWFANPEDMDFKNFESNDLVHYRICRVLFGATCSPFLLTATLIVHFAQYIEYDPEVVSKVLESLHVDDLISGDDNEKKVIEFHKNVTKKFKEGGFNLRKFVSNSIEVECTVNSKNDPAYEFIEHAKVLGLDWDKTADVLNFKLRNIIEKSIQPVTKRNVMHLISSLYDPLGLVNPIVVKLKMYFQKLCVAKLKWDDLLPDVYLQEWNDILNSFTDCSDISFSRLYSYRDAADPFTSIQLHGFSDASSGAYGTLSHRSTSSVSPSTRCKCEIAKRALH